MIKNATDRKITRIVDKTTILVDLRKSKLSINEQAKMVHQIANRHFYGNSDGLVFDHSPAGSGCFFGCNMIEKYHVKSIAPYIWIASNDVELTPNQTRAMVMKYLKIKG